MGKWGGPFNTNNTKPTVNVPTVNVPTVNIPTVNILALNIPTIKMQNSNMLETQKKYKKDTPLARYSRKRGGGSFIYMNIYDRSPMVGGRVRRG